jgi:hypothetical protein
MDVLQGRTAVQSNGNQIYIDLHDVLVTAADDIGLSQSTTQGALQRLDLPPDAGRIVISNDSQRFDTLSWVAKHHRGIALAIIGIPVILFLAGIATARRRRAATRNAGFIVAGVAACSLLALIPLRAFVGSFARDPDVGRAVFTAAVSGFRWQTFILLLIGAAIAAGAILLGVWQRTPDHRPTTEALRRRLPVLRLAGFATAAVILIAWPSPGWRTYVVALGLLAAYLGALWLLTSDSSTAVNIRRRERPGAPRAGGIAGWIAAHATWLRAAGLVAAVVVIVAVPAVTWRTAAFVLVCALGYLALVEWAASRAGPVVAEELTGERPRDIPPATAPAPTPLPRTDPARRNR